MFLIGSTAFDMGREPSDVDYIARPESVQMFKSMNSKKIVLTQKSRFGEIVFMSGSDPIIEFDMSETAIELMDMYPGCPVAPPEALLALKLSHRYLRNSPHFLKTMSDIHKLRAAGVVLNDALKDWVRRRAKVTYDYGHPSLKRDKQNFFSNDEVPYQFDHDTIHEAVKLFDVPAFELIKEDKAEVFCSKEKFMAQPEEIKLATVYEESAVLALERSQIPFNFEPKPLDSFTLALEKVCTSIASGWWREYAWENYHAALGMYNENYVQKFKDALVRGEIRPYVAV